jgi:hypothetical protein
MAFKNLVEYTLPSYWAGYLINADASYLSQDDIDLIDRETKGLGICVDVGDTEDFREWHGMGHMVTQYTFLTT